MIILVNDELKFLIDKKDQCDIKIADYYSYKYILLGSLKIYSNIF